jgi:hypothetical protein
MHMATRFPRAARCLRRTISPSIGSWGG